MKILKIALMCFVALVASVSTRASEKSLEIPVQSATHADGEHSMISLSSENVSGAVSTTSSHKEKSFVERIKMLVAHLYEFVSSTIHSIWRTVVDYVQRMTSAVRNSCGQCKDLYCREYR